MVVPLKLTQFYGHSVPRPRLYDAVKFSDQRVDPPASVNDALLSWASDAHWSMGGLSFKRVRTQGKMEGNVRRLRAFVEDEEGEDRSVSQSKREVASKAAEIKTNTLASKRVSLPLEKKRSRNEEESVVATPVRKLKKMEILEDSEEGSPAFVPATEEQLQKKGRRKSEHAEVDSRHPLKKKGLHSSTEPVYTPNRKSTPTEERREMTDSASGKKKKRGSKSPVSSDIISLERSPEGDDGYLARSSKRVSGEVSLQQSSKARPRARKILTRGSLAVDKDLV